MDVKLSVDTGEYLPLREVVFNSLREAILTGQIQPGERLMEIQLAEKLGVSRTPVREAIRKLEIEGLAVMVPRKGAEVAKITEKQLRDVLEVRKSLEELAVQLACKRISKETVEELEQAHKEVQTKAYKKDLTAMVAADVHFHEIIYRAADNERLLQILNNLRQQMFRYRLEYLKDTDNHEVIVKEHAAILEAVQSLDVVKATKAIGQHIINQENGVISLIEQAEKSEE